MTLSWDYSRHAQTYHDRPPYADEAIDLIVARTGLSEGDRVCDIGAGTGILTESLASNGFLVDAVEPNDGMRHIGQERVAAKSSVTWHETCAERTGLPPDRYRLVTYGSSFNVVDTTASLIETARILRPAGWFSCLWNHRDLDDPLQAEIENLIRRRVRGYRYGSRRTDQKPVIRACGLYTEPIFFEASHVCRVQTHLWLSAWKSHATLARQAGGDFDAIINEIAALVGTGASTLDVPYTTRVYMAQLLDGM